MQTAPDTPFRILVVANDTVDGADLGTTLRRHSRDGRPTHVLIVAPALSSRLRFWVSDVDLARRRAEARLRHSLRDLDGDDLAVEGTIGDSDPVQAAVDASRLFPADELVFVTRPEDEEHWVERELVSRARDRFPDLPIVHLVAGPRRLLELAA